MKYIYTMLIWLAVVSMAGCNYGPNSGKGFSLPEGDVAKGKTTFIELGCNSCHSIADIKQLPSNAKDIPQIVLGGTVRSIKTYGELVTSIINPSHKILRRYNQVNISGDGSSKMRIYNDVMTVTQLVDLVKYLESNYEIVVQHRTVYPKF